MRTFCAESIFIRNGREISMGHTYDAETEYEAEQIARANGWELVGEMVEEEVPDDVVALIEWRMTDPVKH